MYHNGEKVALYNPVVHIARSVWFNEFRAQNLIMITASAYFDDSGTDAANTAMVVAGFVADIDQWGKFNEEWNEVLCSYGGGSFHAKVFDDARRGHGPYSKWQDSKRRQFFERLLGIIIRRTERSIGTVLQKPAYEAVIQPIAQLNGYFGTPYVFCCFNCLHQTREWRAQYHPDVPVRYVFDEGHANQGQLTNAANMLKKHDRFMVDLTTDDDRKLAPLQAADLLAFELCSEARRQTNDFQRDSRYALQRLDEHPHDWMNVSEEKLKRAAITVLTEMAETNPAIAAALRAAETVTQWNP